MRALAWIALALLACSREPPPREAAPAQKPAPVKAAPAPAAKETFRFPAPERLVAIGDLHGDLDATRRALRLAGAIADGDAWAGGKLVLVQTGDQLDRGDDERAIVDLFETLAPQAKAAGGAVHALNGNHETMNVMGDFRYVTEGGFSDFDGVVPAVPEALLARFPEHMRGRVGAFMPGGLYAKKIADRPLAIVVGDTVFAHGGVTPQFAGELQRINDDTAAWMLGRHKAPPQAVVDEDGVVWTRRYSMEESPPDCAGIAQSLVKLGAKRMVMGHTVQRNGVTSACDGKAWRIDVGMAKHYGGPIAVLEIAGGQVRVLEESAAAQAAE